ncbi:hypothetical protein F4808DRAFT_288013 [Astrocystis sublimbata]|nr:hypothetical protein F4808DRAFT_288013 [Astrocystis sublimbata]
MMYASQTPPPPVPPPKPNSHDVSRLGTPAGNSPRPQPPLPDNARGGGPEGMTVSGTSSISNGSIDASGLILAPAGHVQEPIPDPGDAWLPKILEDKSKQDLAEILSNPAALQALTASPATMHPSLAQTQDALLAALAENVALAQHLTELETRLAHQRDATQAQLLSAHALDRQWRAKQADMDNALTPFSPAALYTRLTQALQEQEMLCTAMEVSFLEGDGAGNHEARANPAGDLASERETVEWVRRFREARRLYYLRQERKERWNERRVGGWR